MTWLEALLLGLIQGITEWLPVSSSGHLVLAQHWMGLDVPVAYDLLLHVATLAAVLVVFRRRVAAMTVAVLRDRHSPDARLAFLLVLATLPIVVAGLLFEARIEAAFQSVRVVAIALVVTGLWLASTRYATPRQQPMTATSALLVGIAQAVALVPGISRSGATLGAALHTGRSRDEAAEFAFLLAIPALVGATVLKARDLAALELGAPALLGALTAFAVGIATLTGLLAVIRRVGLVPFAPYCILLGVVAWFV